MLNVLLIKLQGIVKNMNKIIMVIWAIIIVLLLTAICLIGYSHKDKVYMKLEASLKNATMLYLKNYKRIPEFDESAIVFTDDLINEKYIKDASMVDKYCVKSIVFTKGLLKDKYKINMECEIDN